MWLSSLSELEGASDSLSILSVCVCGPCYVQSSLLSAGVQELPPRGVERKMHTSNNANNCLCQGLPWGRLRWQWLAYVTSYKQIITKEKGVWMVGIWARYYGNIKEEFQVGVSVGWAGVREGCLEEPILEWKGKGQKEVSNAKRKFIPQTLMQKVIEPLLCAMCRCRPWG